MNMLFDILAQALPPAQGYEVNYAFLQFLAMAAPLIGKMLGGGAKAAASSRGAAIDAGLSRDQIATQRGNLQLGQDDENRAERDSAWKTLQRVAYAKDQANPAQRPGYLPEQYFNPNAVRRTSQMELDGAKGLEGELMSRLQGGPRRLNLPALTDVNKLSKPSLFEKIAGFAQPALGAFSTLYGARQPQDDDPWRE